MKRYISIAFVFAATMLLFTFGACSDDDENSISEEWIDYQSKLVDKVSEEYPNKYKSESGLGFIYSKPSDFITQTMVDANYFKLNSNLPFAFKDEDKDGIGTKSINITKADSYRPTLETDTVLVRYEGWFYSLDGKKIIFDSTERSTSDYTSSFNNAKTWKSAVSGVVDGFKTMLLNMEVSDEVIVCIPYKLGYKVTGYGNIPGYATLFFDLKLLRNYTAEREAKK